MTKRLGKIEIVREYGTITAWLNQGLTWECENPAIRLLLDMDFPASRYSPADGMPGSALLHDAAKSIGGVATWLGGEPGKDTGRVY